MLEASELALLLLALGGAGWGTWRLWIRPWRELRRDRRRLEGLLRPPPVHATERREEARAPGKLERRLRAAGLTIQPLRWRGIQLLVALGIALLSLEIAPRALWLAAGLGAFVAWLLGAFVVRAALRRSWRFETRLVDAVDLFVGALEAGENPIPALASAANGAREPVRGELREVVARLRAGAPLETAVAPLLLRYDSEGVRVFTQTLRAKWAVGGDLAPVMRAVNQTLRQRLTLRRELRSHLAGAQLSALLVALLPYALLPIFYWRRPEALEAIWSHPLGPTLLVGAILLQLLGLVWLRRLLRMEL